LNWRVVYSGQYRQDRYSLSIMAPGSRSMSLSNVRAAPVGECRCCSQFLRVAVGIPRAAAKASCEPPAAMRMAFTSILHNDLRGRITEGPQCQNHPPPSRGVRGGYDPLCQNHLEQYQRVVAGSNPAAPTILPTSRDVQFDKLAMILTSSCGIVPI
jgi:hypothetical protein